VSYYGKIKAKLNNFSSFPKKKISEIMANAKKLIEQKKEQLGIKTVSYELISSS
jgi:hypothetical protein